MPSQFIGVDGSVITAKDDAQAKVWRDNGLAEATSKDLDHAAVKEKFSGWASKLGAISTGIVGAIPGATSALTYATAGVRSLAYGTSFDQSLQDVGTISAQSHEANPGYEAVGTALGLGAQLATGVGAVGAAAKVGTVAAGAKLAGQGAAAGLAFTADELATQHALSGHGSEKLFAELGTGALFGAALNVGFAGAGKLAGKAFTGIQSALGEAGAALVKKSEDVALKGAMTERAVQKLSQNGQKPEVIEYMKANNMFAMSQDQIKAKTREHMKEAQGLFKQARFSGDATMELGPQLQLVQDVKQLTAGMDPAVFKLINKHVGTAKPATIGKLHDARQALDKLVDYEDIASPLSRQLLQARSFIDNAIGDVLAVSGDGRQARAWAAANETFRNAASVQMGLKSAAASGASFWQWAGGVGGTAAGAAAANELEAPPAIGSVAGLAAGSALGAAVANRGALAGKVAGQLGKMLHSFDSKTAQLVVAKLSGKASAPGATLAAEALTVNHYDQVAPMLQLVAQNPDRGIEAAVAHLNAQNVPGPVQDQIIQQHQTAVQVLNSMIPANPYAATGTVAPSANGPTRQQKMQYMEGVEAIRDPIGALHDPTPTKMAVIKQVYPQVYGQLQQVVGEEVAQRPALHPKARRWAGAILGMSPDNLASPQAQGALKQLDMLRQMQAQAAAQGQSGGSKGGRPAGGGGSATITETQASRLSK